MGVPGFEVTAWQGVLAPKSTPAAIVERLNNAIRLALVSDDMQSQLMARSAKALGSTPADYARFIQEEDMRWGAIIRAADIRLH
ncbi:hypothetical protein AKI39_22255 [Bordetella sp. H567]|nr:hypothetical protein AKI39_22255 [Bordetella sp. H567]